LGAYYDARIAAWFADNVPTDNGDEETNRTSSGDDHE
jgi:hypothetical protein